MISKAEFRLSRVLLLTVGHFTVDFYAGFIPVLVPVLQRAVGFTLTEAAILVSAFSLSASFSQTLFGVLFDRWRSVRLVAFAPMLAAVTLSCIGIMPSYISLIFLVIAGGLSVAAFHPYGASLAALASGSRHSVGMSLFVTGGTMGVAVGALVAAALVDRGGLSATVYAVVFGCLVAFLIRRNINGRPVPQEKKYQAVGTLPTGYGFLFGLGILAMIRAFVILGFQTFVPLYLTALGTPLPTVGLTLFVFGIAGGFGGLTSGTWAERFGEKGVLFASFLIPIPLFLGYLLLGTSVAGIACFGLAGYSIVTGVPILIAISQRSFPRRVGTISSFVMGVSWGMAGIGITPAGMFAERFGLYSTLWVLGLTGFVGFPVAVLLFRRQLVPAISPARNEAKEIDWETT